MERRLIVACAALLIAGAAFAAAPGVKGPAGPNSEAAPVVLATGPNSGDDGYLSIELDEYGSWGDFGAGVLPDSFNPAGASPALPIAFTAGNYIFVPARNQKELLTTMPEWLAVYVDDPATSISITSANNPGDLNGDGVFDAAASSFTMTGGGTDLSIDLTQQVVSLGGGVADLIQTYSITNNEGSPITIEMVHNFDGDMLYDGDFTSDEVGTTWNNAGGDTYVYMQEPGDSATAVTVAAAATSYYGGKLGILPGGVPPAYGFGTDIQIYDTGSLPDNWENHIAGVGYDLDGVSGPAPSGCDIGTGCDAFIGLSIEVTIGAGATETVVMTHTYGANTPGGGGGVPFDFNIVGECPGETTLTATGGTPNGNAGIIHSTMTGNTPLGAGPCVGTPSGLNNPQLFTIVPLDANGEFSLTRTAPAGVCGRFLQLVDAAAGCALSDVIQVPN